MKYYILALIMGTECLAALTNQPCKNRYLADLLKVDTDLRAFYEASEWRNPSNEQTITFFKKFLAQGDFTTNARRIYQVAEEKVPKEALNDTKTLIAESIIDHQIEAFEAKIGALKNRKALIRKLGKSSDSPSASS